MPIYEFPHHDNSRTNEIRGRHAVASRMFIDYKKQVAQEPKKHYPNYRTEIIAPEYGLDFVNLMSGATPLRITTKT